MLRLSPVLACAALVAACGSSPNVPAAAPQPAAPVAAAPAPLPPGHLRRSDLLATLSSGLGAFLARVEVEPTVAGNKFHGWRVVSLPGDTPEWKSVELAPGDVVTAVNGLPVERPEQALVAWQSLALAPELRLACERQGQPREVTWKIDDEAAPKR